MERTWVLKVWGGFNKNVDGDSQSVFDNEIDLLTHDEYLSLAHEVRR